MLHCTWRPDLVRAALPVPSLLQGSLQPPPAPRVGYGGGRGGGGRGGPGGVPYDPAFAAAASAGPFGPFGAGAAAAGGRGNGSGRGAAGAAYWGPEAYMGYYPMAPPSPYFAAPAAAGPPMFPRGRGGFFPGGKNWAGARPPPPGQPGFSSGLQVGSPVAGWGGAGCPRSRCKGTGAGCLPLWCKQRLHNLRQLEHEPLPQLQLACRRQLPMLLLLLNLYRTLPPPVPLAAAYPPKLPACVALL